MLCSVCVVYTEQGECSIGKVIRSLLGALLLLRNKSPPLLEELGKLGKGTFQAFSLFQHTPRGFTLTLYVLMMKI